MAETVGLALGTIALASLFSTCIELIDYFEVGRSHEYAYDVACLKLALLSARLETWGEALSVRRAGHEAEALRSHWPQEQDVIARSLLGIQNILGNAEALKNKYKLIPRKSNSLPGLLPGRRKSTLAAEEGASQSQHHTFRRLSLFRRSTKWAIRDKQRFDALLQDLEFFISNLEQVFTRVTMPRSRTDRRKTQQDTSSDSDSDSNDQARQTLKDPTHVPSLSGSSESHSGETRSKLGKESSNKGSHKTIGSHKFRVGEATNQAALILGVNSRSSVPEARPEEPSEFSIDYIRDQSSALLGFNNGDSINQLLANQRAMVQLVHGSGGVGGQVGTATQTYTNFSGQGRKVGGISSSR